MARFIRILLAVLLGVVITAPAASAAPDRKLEALLGDLFETVLEIPTPKNPLAGNGNPCVPLGKKVVAPFQAGTEDLTCTVKSGTKIFVAAFAVECSTVEQPPFRGDDEAELRTCVRAFNLGAVTITVDGKEVPLTEVETPLLNLVLPADNVLVEAEEPVPADSVGRGFVALLQPLPPGTHQIVINVSGSAVVSFSTTTTIVVQPGQSRAA
jgi:hypothetical protein